MHLTSVNHKRVSLAVSIISAEVKNLWQMVKSTTVLRLKKIIVRSIKQMYENYRGIMKNVNRIEYIPEVCPG